jgi:hypothetical protein
MQRFDLVSSTKLLLLLHDTSHALSSVSIQQISTHPRRPYRVRPVDILLPLYFESPQSTTVLAVAGVRNARVLLPQVEPYHLSCFDNVGILNGRAWKMRPQRDQHDQFQIQQSLQCGSATIGHTSAEPACDLNSMEVFAFLGNIRSLFLTSNSYQLAAVFPPSTTSVVTI